jgi:hypothetical protein
MQALENPEGSPPRVVNPRTKETFVLLCVADYERLKEEEHDDSPWTSEEPQALAWEGASTRGGRTWTSTTMPRRSPEPRRRDPGPLPAPVWAAREEAACRRRAVRCPRGSRQHGSRRRGPEELDDGRRPSLSVHRREHTRGKGHRVDPRFRRVLPGARDCMHAGRIGVGHFSGRLCGRKNDRHRSTDSRPICWAYTDVDPSHRSEEAP